MNAALNVGEFDESDWEEEFDPIEEAVWDKYAQIVEKNKPLLNSIISDPLYKDSIDQWQFEDTHNTLEYACITGDQSLVKRCLERGDLACGTDGEWRSLLSAVVWGRDSVVNLLLPMAPTDAKEQAVVHASFAGHLQIVQLLFEVDPHLSNCSTALWHATKRCDRAMVCFLLGKGALTKISYGISLWEAVKRELWNIAMVLAFQSPWGMEEAFSRHQKPPLNKQQQDATQEFIKLANDTLTGLYIQGITLKECPDEVKNVLYEPKLAFVLFSFL